MSGYPSVSLSLIPELCMDVCRYLPHSVWSGLWMRPQDTTTNGLTLVKNLIFLESMHTCLVCSCSGLGRFNPPLISCPAFILSPFLFFFSLLRCAGIYDGSSWPVEGFFFSLSFSLFFFFASVFASVFFSFLILFDFSDSIQILSI